MSALYLDAADVARRRAMVAPGGPFAPLAASLAADLRPVIARPVWIPGSKARLTRIGGSCPRDGARLRFDPFAPHAHACPTCGAVYARPEDHDWWVMGYQLWLAERTVHAAALALLTDHAPAASFAASVLGALADAYLGYPNADNVLGPTRPFFSTYLESLWLLHLCTALDLLELAGAVSAALGARVRDRLIAPSAALVATYPEGRSNRQVWNATARLAAARVLGDDHAAAHAVHGPAGIAALLRDGLLADGTWFEGDNYHQFAHRGFWYALRLAAATGIAIDPVARARFTAGYDVPFRVALPDETLPARRDSQYPVSLRQWRWAEWCELGRADGAGAGLAGSLARLYAPAAGAVAHETGRWRSTGEAERNEPPSTLSRADLGWKSLLFAAPEPPVEAARVRPASLLLPEQGFAILRPGGRVYVGLDYGGGGGGHGHPDRLNVILQDGEARWLDDPGTGTYVERALHWYRSTLAHAAPLVDGASQRASPSWLLGFDPGNGHDLGFAGVAARVALQRANADAAPVQVDRTLVAAATYVVDLFTWHTAAELRTIDVPLHVDGDLVATETTRWHPFDPGGAGGLEDGFDFVEGAQALQLTGPTPARLRLRAPGGDRSASATATLWLVAPGTTLWRATAPGPPGTPARRFHVVRSSARSGALLAVWDLDGRIAAVTRDATGTIVVTHADGRTDRHSPPRQLHRGRAMGPESWSDCPTDDQQRGSAERDVGDWEVWRELPDGAMAGQRLALVRPVDDSSAPAPRGDGPHAPPTPLPADGSPLVFALGEAHYLRSETRWQDAGGPRATVVLRATGATLTIDVDVALGRLPAFVPPGATNALDNERADVNSDGLQLSIRPARAPLAATWLLVPEGAPSVRVTATSPTASDLPLTATWSPQPAGWRLTCGLPLDVLGPAGGSFALDLAVNERPPGRERRRGQLLLSGAGVADDSAGAFVYLRGDRMDAARALLFRLPGAPAGLSTAPADP